MKTDGSYQLDNNTIINIKKLSRKLQQVNPTYKIDTKKKYNRKNEKKKYLGKYIDFEI